jgi:hypothetical protein
MAKKTNRKAARGIGKPGKAAGASAARLRSLFTPAERKLLAAADGPGLAKAARADVQDWLKRARALRDKWRDLVGAQTRKQKRGPQATAEANARSREKADLFHAAVGRLEQRLAALQTVASKPAAGPKQPGRRSRTAAHRTARAGVRAALAEKVAMLNLAGGRSPAGLADRPAVAGSPRGAVAAEPPVAAAKARSRAAAARPAAGARRTPRGPITAAVGGTPQAVRFDRSQQRSARTEAKNARLKLKGSATRRGSHLAASVKRAQARRDQRSR